MIKIICAICNKKFESNYWNAKYCCSKCSSKGEKLRVRERLNNYLKDRRYKKYDIINSMNSINNKLNKSAKLWQAIYQDIQDICKQYKGEK